jgi:hypothetical protein
MASRVDDLLDHLGRLERELGSELDGARAKWRYRVDAGHVRFEHDVHATHLRLRQSIPRFLRESSIPNMLTMPIIGSLIVPVALLDLWVTLYQAICFRVYGIALVPRSKYILLDREQLAYLNVIEKANCFFCGYANGVFAYVREVAARTEQYWCPIRHAKRVLAPHTHYRQFVDYGDAEGYHRRLMYLRNELRPLAPKGDA